jgi:ABC-type uncharacterized transport system fused permease/ATPase subunit
MTSNKVVVAATLEQDTLKGSKIVVEQVRELVELRAEIGRLDKLKDALTAEVEKAFGVDKKAKTSTATTLTHNGIEFVRYDWRTRKGIDEALLAEKFPEAYEACFKPDKTIYGVIVSLFK